MIISDNTDSRTEKEQGGNALGSFAAGVLKSTPAADMEGGLALPIENLPEPAAGSESGFALPIENIPDVSDEAQTPLFTPLPDGSYKINREIDRDELTPLAKQMYDINPNSILDALITANASGGEAELRRHIFANMDTADKLLLTLPEQEGTLADIEAKTGFSPDFIRHLQQTDPEYLKKQIEKNEVLANSGYAGYITREMQNPTSPQALRYDAVRRAQIEAGVISLWGTKRDQVGYDIRVGFGQVGAFGLNVLAGGARMLADIDEWSEKNQRARAQEMGWAVNSTANSEGSRGWARDLEEYAKNKQAQWLGPALDTGNPVTDWLRTSIFQGTPFLASLVVLSMLTGPAASAGIIAGGMGFETYGETRAAGVSPLLALASAAGTTATSYFVNRFQLNRWTRNIMGRSPFGQFSVGTAIETAQEVGTEAVESLGQGFFAASAKLIGGPGYTRDDWWRDMKESGLNALSEGGAAGALSFVTRLPDLPRAARNQARSHQSNRTFKDMGVKAAETTLYKEQPRVLAEEINNMARHHGGAGIVFSSAMELEQGGLTRQEVVDGLGITREEFDFAKANNVDIAIPVGNAVVFAQQQADAGNTYFQNVLRADPDAMTGREIAEQSREVAAVLDAAEVKFKAMATESEAAMPLRLRTFRAGLRAFGFSPNEADASTSVFWARGERAADLWGISLDEWLDQKNVQLEMKGIIRDTREMARYQRLLEQVNIRGTAIDVFAEGDTAQANVAAAGESVQPVAETSPAVPDLEQVEQQEVAGAVDESVQPVQDLVQPVETPADNAAWVESVADTIASELAVDGEQRAAVVEQTKQLISAGIPIYICVKF